MALKHGDTYFCKWLHFENGRLTHRRLHVLEIQARDGRIYSIQGDKLPQALVTSTGDKVQGEHVAQILLHPEKTKRLPLTIEKTPSPLTFRDIMAMIFGFWMFPVFFLAIHFLRSF